MNDSYIGGYRILGELGRGAMGVVYHAFDPKIGRPVAIKQIRVDPGATADQGAQLRQRLVREASAAGNLSHPGIVTVYQLGEEGTDVFIVMEYVAGASLERALAVGTGMDLNRKLEILRQTAEALDFAHRAGIVHRDVKPANILLREDGVVKVADFGIAKMTQEMTVSQNLTAAGSSLGSPAYMSPEQIRAAQVDGRSDQFSLGVLAFQMLTGRMPFAADTVHAMMYQIVAADPFADQPADLSPSIAAALAPALAKDPKDRYHSCAALVQALAKASGSPSAQMAATQPLPMPPPSPAPSTQASNPRTALMAGLIGAVLVVGIAGGGYWFWQSRAGAAATGGSGGETKAVPAPLVKAIEMGQIDESQRLLAAGADINQADEKGTTALMQAAEGSAYLPNNASAVTMLLDKGATVDLQDKSGRTALYRAVAEGKDDVVRQLLAKKADPNHKDSNGSPILVQAVQYGRLALLPLLIQSGAQVELADAHATTPLMLAAEGTAYMPNNAPLVSALLDAGAKVEVQDDRGRTPLYRAATEGKQDALRLLLEKHADPNQRANDGSTALLEAVTYGKTGAAKMLIDNAAAVEQPDANGNTPLMVAAEGSAYVPNNGPWVEMLLAAGAKVDAQDQRGRTPLYRAAAEGKEDAERLLCSTRRPTEPAGQ